MNKLPSESGKFMSWIRSKYDYIMGNSNNLTLLKKNNLPKYKETIWKQFNVLAHAEYTQVFKQPDKWFEGSTLNYTEHIFRQKTDDKPAIIYAPNSGESVEITWQELITQTTSFADYLHYLKIKPGDVVVGVTEKMPEQIMTFLACNAVGAIWANLSPETAEKDLINAFQQIEPKLLIANESYFTDGKQINNSLKINNLATELPQLREIIVLPSIPPLTTMDLIKNGKYWNATFSMAAPNLCFEALPYNHPLFITFKKNTGNLPEVIKHQQGEILLERFAGLSIEQKLTADDVVSSNYDVAAPLLIGATLALLVGDEEHPEFKKLAVIQAKY